MHVFLCLPVVLLRACWMQRIDQCIEDGDATICTCTSDLCNSGSSLAPPSQAFCLLLAALASAFAFCEKSLSFLDSLCTCSLECLEISSLKFFGRRTTLRNCLGRHSQLEYRPETTFSSPRLPPCKDLSLSCSKVRRVLLSPWKPASTLLKEITKYLAYSSLALKIHKSQ